MQETKFCQRCGLIISRLSEADWYSHMSIKYCESCKVKVEKEKTAERVAEFRKRKKQKDKFRDEQLELLKAENELLRKNIIQLREKLS